MGVCTPSPGVMVTATVIVSPMWRTAGPVTLVVLGAARTAVAPAAINAVPRSRARIPGGLGSQRGPRPAGAERFTAAFLSGRKTPPGEPRRGGRFEVVPLRRAPP